MRRSIHTAVGRWAGGLAAAAVVLALTLPIFPWEEPPPYSLFLLASLVISILAGMGPAVFLLLAGVAHGFGDGVPTGTEPLRLATFALGWAAIAWAGGRVHASTARQQELLLRAEEAKARLLASEERFRLLFEGNLAGVVLADGAGVLRQANDAFLTLVGRTRGDLEAGRLRWDLLTPLEWREEVDVRMRAELEAYGACGPFEKEYLRPDGSRVAVQVGARRVDLSADLHCVAYVVDLTAIRAVEAERDRLLAETVAARTRAEAERAEQAFLDRISLAMLEEPLDPGQRLERVAQESLARLGDYCLCDLVEEGRPRVLAAATRDPALKPELIALEAPGSQFRGGLRRAALGSQRTERVSDIDEELLRRWSDDPRQRSIVRRLHLRSAVAVPLVAQGRPLGVLSFGSRRPNAYGAAEMSLAEQVAHRAVLALEGARLYRTAQEATALRERMLAVVSHDLRSPLTSVRTDLDLLLRRLRGDSRTVAQLARMERGLCRMEGLIRDLLDFAQLRHGRLSLQLSSVPIAELLEETMELFEVAAERKRLRLHVKVVPPLDHLRCDRARLGRVLANLVGNAVKYTPPGGRISVTAAPQLGGCLLRVTDTGPGIPPDELPRLFEPYRRASGVRGEGVGLGLAIVAALVEAHGGRIEATSVEGVGSCFTVRLPLEPRGLGAQAAR